MTENLVDNIKKNYTHVLNRIAAAAESVGRDPADVKLVVVTKAHPVEVVQAAVAAGAGILGENYVQEALGKMEALQDQKVEWHMIGHVQSRKARDVVRNFSCMHSLDRDKVARRCDQFAGQAGLKFPVLLECNVSGEASKHGWPAWEEEHWPQLAETLTPVFGYDNIVVRGLMTMPPFGADPEESRPYFIRLRRLRDFLADRFLQADWVELSMGMSNDYEVAVQEGATIVRVGTAIVGSRYCAR